MNDSTAVFLTPCVMINFFFLMILKSPFSVDGGYSPFTNWSDCTETCGGGEQTRTRTCTNPEPQLGGKDCSSFGPDFEKRKCNTQKCPGNFVTRELNLYTLV